MFYYKNSGSTSYGHFTMYENFVTKCEKFSLVQSSLAHLRNACNGC